MIESLRNSMDSPEYDNLPEAIKLVHTKEQYKWLGEERHRIIERETQPDDEVIE